MGMAMPETFTQKWFGRCIWKQDERERTDTHSNSPGFTTAHGAVIDTNPPKTPLRIEGTHQILATVYLSKVATIIPPDAAANVVFTATFDANSIAPAAANVDPQLNPYHPNHKIKVPMACIETL